MSVLQWNCRGYRGNFEELKTLIMHQKTPSCICLQETFHGAVTPYPPSSYKIYAADAVINYEPHTRPPRGVITLVQQDIPHYPVALNTDLEAIAIRINLHKEYTICNIYITPTEVVTKDQIIQLTRQLPKPFLLVGDFNARSQTWGDSVCNEHGREVEDFLQSTDTCLLNSDEPTHYHIQTDTLSCIDLAFTSPDIINDFSWKPCDDPYNSDHFPIVMSPAQSNRDNIAINPKFNLKKADWSSFKTATNIPEDAQDNSDDINATVSYFTDVLLNAALNHIPQTNPISGKYPVPWWNEECEATHGARKIARRRYQRTKTLTDKIALNRASAIARRTKRTSRKQNWQGYVSSVNSETPIPKIWERIRKIRQKFGASGSPCITDGNITVMEPAAVSNLLACHLSKVSSNRFYSNEFNTIRERAEKVKPNFQSNNNENFNTTVSLNEINSALQKCNETAPGEDQIHYSMIKNLSKSALSFLLKIYNRIFLNDIFPAAWRNAIVLPFLKPDKAPNLTTSYRPIALTSCLCKLLEKIINVRLVFFLESNQFFSPYQYGFRKNRSTIDSLISLQSDIYNSFKLKNHLVAVFFDIEKAYDTTWKYNILKTLSEMGVKGHLALFIDNFLSSRMFKVRVGSTFSNTFEQQQGVPQGSVLSVTLFGLAINNIAKDIPDDIKKNLFVDDLAIYLSSSTIPSIERKLQLAINKISSWTAKKGFKISESKTVAIHFHRRRGLQSEPNLNINGNRISFQPHAKFLGLIFDQRLYWRPHIDYLKKKCLKSLNLLKCLSNTHWGSDRLALLRIYRATTRSQLDYGCEAYASAPDHVLNRLNAVHNLAIRLCTGAFRSSPIPSLMAESGEPPLSMRRHQLCCQQYLRSHRLPNSPSSLIIFRDSHSDDFTALPHSKPFGALSLEILNRLNIHIPPTLPSTMPVELSEPPWLLPSNLVCSFKLPRRKREYPPSIAQRIFNDHRRSDHHLSIHLYTDGSKVEEGTGFGVHSRNINLSVKLHDDASIYTAELYAILEALDVLEEQQGNNFTVFCDSLSAIQGLNLIGSTHPIVLKIQSQIIKLNRLGTTVTFCWVPSHVDIQGNEAADHLAKEGATSSQTPANKDLPYTDSTPIIKSKVKAK